MEYIKIPLPDFSFAEIAKQQASVIIERYLHIRTRALYVQGFKEYEFESNIRNGLDKLISNEDKLICICELLNYLTDEILDVKRAGRNSEADINKYIAGVNKIKYYIYSLATSLGYNFDKNSFSNEEVSDLDRKINAILIKLDEIQVANEVIFNEVEELKNKLKEDFESLKSDYPLGKKRWYQRAAGVVVSYAGTKGADEVYGQLKPLIYDFFINYAPHLIDKL